jgi:hypothetical protein
MTLKSRLARLEHHAPQAGEHAPVTDIDERPDVRVQVYRCTCRDPGCRWRPELRIVLNGRGNRAL